MSLSPKSTPWADGSELQDSEDYGLCSLTRHLIATISLLNHQYISGYEWTANKGKAALQAAIILVTMASGKNI